MNKEQIKTEITREVRKVRVSENLQLLLDFAMINGTNSENRKGLNLLLDKELKEAFANGATVAAGLIKRSLGIKGNNES